MRIFITIFNQNNQEPDKSEYNGNYAIETMLIKTSEKYFGSKVANKIEDLLKSRVDVE